MLDVHPAHHAASSWKEFFIRIATIVVGLLIAVGLEQMVELVHHRRELAQVRRELNDQRETNRKALAKETGYWRWETVELKNNLMVLAYLQSHPGTADEKLPGSLQQSPGCRQRGLDASAQTASVKTSQDGSIWFWFRPPERRGCDGIATQSSPRGDG